MLFVIILFSSSVNLVKIRKEKAEIPDAPMSGIGFDTFPDEIFVYGQYPLVLELTGGNGPSSELKVQKRAVNDQDSQKFKSVYTGETGSRQLIFYTDNSNKFALAPRADGVIGAANYEEAQANNDTSNFIWKAEDEWAGRSIYKYRFVHVKTGKCMNVWGGMKPGFTVGLYDCNKKGFAYNEVFTDSMLQGLRYQG